MIAPVAQWIRALASEAMCAGSSPARGTTAQVLPKGFLRKSPAMGTNTKNLCG